MFYLLLPIHCTDGYAIDPFEYTHLSDAIEDAVGSDWYELYHQTSYDDYSDILSSDTDGVLSGPIAP